MSACQCGDGQVCQKCSSREAPKDLKTRMKDALDQVWSICDSDFGDRDPFGALAAIADIVSDFEADETEEVSETPDNGVNQ